VPVIAGLVNILHLYIVLKITNTGGARINVVPTIMQLIAILRFFRSIKSNPPITKNMNPPTSSKIEMLIVFSNNSIVFELSSAILDR